MKINSNNSSKISYLPLVMTLASAVTVITFQISFSAVVSELQAVNNLSRFMATILISSPSFFIILLSTFSGKLLDRINPIKISIYSFFAVIIISTAGLFVHGFWNILFLRLIIGIPFAPLLVMGLQLPQLIYPAEIRNRMVTIQTLGAPIGAIIMLFCGAWIGTIFGYTYTYFVTIFFSLIGFVASIILLPLKIKRKHISKKTKPTLKPVSKMLAFSWMFFTGSTSIFLYLGTELGKSLGLPLFLAVFGSAFLMIPPLIVSPIAGELMDKRVSRFKLIIISSILMIIAFQLLWIGIVPWIIGAVLLGSSGAIIPPIIFTTPSKFEKQENTGYLLGQINMFGTLGILLFPPLAGLINDITSGWWLPMVFAGLLISGIIIVGIKFQRSLS